MNANELRIGNYVLYKDKIVLILGINTDVFETIGSNYETVTDNNIWLSPTPPLTEEWLLKFGFDKKVYPNKTIEYSLTVRDIDFLFHIRKIVSNELEFMIYAGDDGKLPIKCEYVHNLQNIIFASTGEELTIK
jgi:hypothetical protein